VASALKDVSAAVPSRGPRGGTVKQPLIIPIHRYGEIQGRDLQTVPTDAPLAAFTRERQTSLIKGAACAPSDKTGETR
jgi:hypothetical protein